MAIIEALQTPDGLLPMSSQSVSDSFDEKISLTMEDMIQRGGHGLMYPILTSTETSNVEKTTEEALMQFSTQLGGITMDMIDKKKALLPTKNKKQYY
jgi:hypothetical protein